MSVKFYRSISCSIDLNVPLSKESLSQIIHRIDQCNVTFSSDFTDSIKSADDVIIYFGELLYNNPKDDLISVDVKVEGTMVGLVFSEQNYKNKLHINLYTDSNTDYVWVKPIYDTRTDFTYDIERYMRFLLNVTSDFELLSIKYELGQD